MTNFDFQNLRSVYDTSGKVTSRDHRRRTAAKPSSGRWMAKEASMLVTAKFA
jgi:hypothetical protein